MAGSLIVTDLDPKTVVKLVMTIAEDEGYDVERVEKDEVTIGKNNAFLSVFPGALFFPYARFRAFIAPDGTGKVEIELERNFPWWQGWYGWMRVNGMFKKLVNAIEDEIEEIGGRILQSENL